jgi:hypothetical protein
MKAAQLMAILAALLAIPAAIGIVDVNGDFLTPTPAQDAQIAAAVEGVLKAHGVTVPEKVEAVVAMLPFLLGLLK